MRLPPRRLLLLAASAACAAPPPPPSEPAAPVAAPVAAPPAPPLPLPASGAPVMVGKHIVDPYSGKTLAEFSAAPDHEFALPAAEADQYWVGDLLCDVGARKVLRTAHQEFRVDAHATVVRLDAAGAQLWASTPGERVGSLRPPEILGDEAFVLVAVASGIAVLDGATGALLRTLKGPHDHLVRFAGHVVAVDCTSPGARPERWLVAHDAASGQQVFRVALPTDEEPETPVVVGDDLLVRGRKYSILLSRDGQPRLRLAERIAQIEPTPTGWFITSDRRIFALTRDGETAWEQSGFAETFVHETRLLALPDGDLLLYNFGAIADSGVELVRLDARGHQRWRSRCRDAGVSHSEYYHHAYVALRGDDLVVVSQGSEAAWIEILDARTGASRRRIDAL